MTTQEVKNRTFDFGMRVINVVETLPRTETARILGRQLLRAGTSVGANYRAAARARSPADFISKLGVVEEECDESAYWIEMILARKLLNPAKLNNLHTEANELLAIIVASIKTARDTYQVRSMTRKRIRNSQSAIRNRKGGEHVT